MEQCSFLNVKGKFSCRSTIELKMPADLQVFLGFGQVLDEM